MLSMPLKSVYHRPSEPKNINKSTRHCRNTIVRQRAHRSKTQLNQSRKFYSFVYKFYIFLITVPPMTRGIYTCYYKLDGFNHSLGNFHLHMMPAWLVWVVVAMSELVFFIYGIKHGALDNTPKTPNALCLFLKKLLKSISPVSLYENIYYNKTMGDRGRALARFIILINLVFYVWVAGDAAYVKFYSVFDYSFRSMAILIGVFCAIGALMGTMTFTLMVVEKAFPHLLKIRTIYANPVQKILGVFLVLLALLSAPLTIIMAKDSSTSLFFIIFFTILATLLVYVMSVYGLCRKQIDRLNEEMAALQIKHMIDQVNNPFEKRLLEKLLFWVNAAHYNVTSVDNIVERNVVTNKLKRCVQEIDDLNRQMHAINMNKEAKVLWRKLMNLYKKGNENIKKRDQSKTTSFLQSYVFSRKLPACILFLTSSSVTSIGTGFSCQALLSDHAQVSRLGMWGVFIVVVLIAIIGKMCFSSMAKTVHTITHCYEHALSKVVTLLDTKL